jgi:hypothetical protein
MTATLRAAHARHAHHSGQRLDDTLDQYAGAMFSSFLCPADRATLHIIGTRAYHLAAKAPARAYLAAPTWLRAGERWVAVYLGANVPAPRAVPVPAAIEVPPGRLAAPCPDRAHLTATLGDHRVRLCPMPDTWSETVLTINRWQRADPDLHDFGTDKIDGDCPEYAAVKACLLATAIDRAERDEDARGMLGATSNDLV